MQVGDYEDEFLFKEDEFQQSPLKIEISNKGEILENNDRNLKFT